MTTSATCPECGAPVSDSSTCRENFHALLALEWQTPEGAGTTAHFFAVASYVLQHPGSMGYTIEAIEWLRSAVGEVLATGRSVESLRAAARVRGQDTHVTRREGDAVPDLGVERWTTTVADVLAGGSDRYAVRVADWAASVYGDLGARPEA